MSAGHVGSPLHKAGDGPLHLVAPHSSLAFQSPYPRPRQGQGPPREWGLAFLVISIQDCFEKEPSQNFANLKNSHPSSVGTWRSTATHPPTGRPPAEFATAEVTVINGEADACFPKVFREECLRLRRLKRYVGMGGAQVPDEFVAGLRTYLHFYA